MDFYTADLYLILLSDHNDNFSKYNKKIVTGYSFKEMISHCLMNQEHLFVHETINYTLWYAANLGCQ